MTVINTDFSGQNVDVCFDAIFSDIQTLHPSNKIIILTDEHIYDAHSQKFNGYACIKIKSGEANKNQQAVDGIILQMLEMDADKSYMLIGVGGGVVTDMAGYVASIYKRGIKLGLVPTSILGMVDAAIGGKNGVNVGIYKNMVGTTYRPSFILYDYSFLDTLPHQEWVNGFAEIIKHACIKNVDMFNELLQHNIEFYIENRRETRKLIEQNVQLKMDVVVHDELEKADRYLLNYGHTFGHAIENIHQLPHGFAISIGMVMAAKISEEINNFDSLDVIKISELLTRYQLPVTQEIDRDKILSVLIKDKKRDGADINFVLLNRIGDAVAKKIPITQLTDLLHQSL